jgi:hypothetical protein
MRPLSFAAALSAAILATPSVALATEPGRSAFLSVPPVSLIVSLIGLGVAGLLLVEALMIKRVASGGAIAEKITYVILAIVCLAAAAIASWLVNFVNGVTLDQLRFVSDVLVTAAMALLAAYFSGVRRALEGYLKSAQDMLASSATTTEPTEAE